jgi:hypothetical protein
MRASRLLEIEPVILGDACFHCQQALEKCLKSYLAFYGREIERTHISSECSNFDPVFADIDPANINEYAVQAR